MRENENAMEEATDLGCVEKIERQIMHYKHRTIEVGFETSVALISLLVNKENERSDSLQG